MFQMLKVITRTEVTGALWAVAVRNATQSTVRNGRNMRTVE